jgi:hypothetical protein
MRFGLYEVELGPNHDGVNATYKRRLRAGVVRVESALTVYRIRVFC